MGVLQRCSQQKGGTPALGKLIIGSKASAATSSAAAPPNLDRTVGLHASVAAQQAEVRVPGEEDGFISKRTESGGTYGSLEPYIDTWNNADMAEVSSNPQPHPGGPSATARRLFEAGILADRLSRSLHVANATAKVRFYICVGPLSILTRQNICLSPVPEIRVEYAILDLNLFMFC